MGEAVRQVEVLNLLNPDESRIPHGIGKTVAPFCLRGGTDKLRTVFPEVLPADGLVARLPVGTADPAAFVAEKLQLPLMCTGQCVQTVKCLVQAEIRHDIAKFRTLQFCLQLPEFRQNLCCRGDEIEIWIPLPKVSKQQVRTENHSVPDRPAAFKQGAQRIAVSVGEMLGPEQGIAEGEAGGNPMIPHERRHILRPVVTEADAPAAPETVGGSAVDGANLTPVIEKLPVTLEQRQENAI